MRAVARLAIILTLVQSTPAHGCHLYKHWGYPWPQKCGTANASGAGHTGINEDGPPNLWCARYLSSSRVGTPIIDIAVPLSLDHAALQQAIERREKQ
jgi:hypothetical protein